MKVLVVKSFNQQGLDMLFNNPKLNVTVLDDMTKLEEEIVDADIITVRTQELSPELLAKAKNLKMVSKHGVGVDNIAVEHLTGRNIPVAIAYKANAYSVAEHALALMLAISKNMYLNDKATREGNYKIRETVNACCIAEKSVLICGFGRIGRTLADLCKCFGMSIYVYDPFLTNDTLNYPEAKLISDLHASLPEMDYVSLHMPLSDISRNLFGKKEFELMKDSAFVVNCARGGIVNEPDMVEALKNKTIAGYATDVFESEPPSSDDPLFALDNIVVSPHNAAMTKEGAIKMATQCAQNVNDFVAGCLETVAVVNKQVL